MLDRARELWLPRAVHAAKGLAQQAFGSRFPELGFGEQLREHRFDFVLAKAEVAQSREDFVVHGDDAGRGGMAVRGAVGVAEVQHAVAISLDAELAAVGSAVMR